MDRKKVPIVLVLSFSPSFCEKLNKILVRLSFKNIDKLEWDHLLKANIDHFNTLIVIPVSQRNDLSRKMKVGFENIRKMPVLGVIQAHEEYVNDDLLNYFNEFLCWPCLENEFAMRLEHLYNRFRIASEPTGDTKRLEDFIDLNMVGRSPQFVHVLEQISLLIEG